MDVAGYQTDSTSSSFGWTTGNNQMLAHNRVIYLGGPTEVHELCNIQTGEVFARKLVRAFDTVSLNEIRNEFRAITKLAGNGPSPHRNIVHILRYGHFEENESYHFLDMELCDVDLEMYITHKWTSQISKLNSHQITKLSQKTHVSQLWDIMLDISKGLVFIHSLNEIHRDLKPRNVLYSCKQEVWKIADFGITVQGTSTRAPSTVFSRGTPTYRAPELILESAVIGNKHHYTNKVDIWAFGCILHEILFRTKAFSGDIDVHFYALENLYSGKMLELPFHSLSEYEAKEFLENILRKMLQIDARKRPTALDVHQQFSETSPYKSPSLPDKQLADTLEQMNIVTDKPAQGVNMPSLKDKPVPQEPKVRKKVAIQNPHISPHRKNNPQLATTENTGLATMPEDLSDSAASSVPKAFVIPQLDSTRGGGSVFEIEDASISRLDRQSDSDHDVTKAKEAIPIITPQIYFLVPHQRNPHFVGRDEIIDRIRNNFCSNNPMRYNERLAIFGLGGIGKTQTAIEYAHRNRSKYKGIYWINGTDRASLILGYQRIASETRCFQLEADPKAAARAVVSWLNQQSDWLLVIDNVEEISVLNGYLPKGRRGGHTLITTRDPDYISIPSEGLEMPLLSFDDSIRLLRVRSNTELVGYSEEELDTANEIVKELGYLPLAIEHASAFIRTTLNDLSLFLTVYRRSRRHILSRKPRGNPDYPISVSTMFRLAFDKVGTIEYGDIARKLLSLFAFLSPDGIRIDFLMEGMAGLGNYWQPVLADNIIFYEALDILQRFSLVRRSQQGNVITVHSLVQAVARDELSETEFNEIKKSIIGLCNSAFPKILTPQSMEQCRAFQSQVLAPLLDLNLALTTEAAGDLMFRVCRFLRYDGKFAVSRLLAQKTVEVYTSLKGKNHIDSLKSRLELGEANEADGRLQEAIELEESVVADAELALGVDHATTLNMMTSLAWAYKSAGRFAEASAVQEKALERSMAANGPEALSTIWGMLYLALMYCYQSRLNEAIQIAKDALEASIKTLGHDNRTTAESKTIVATVYHEMWQLEDANPLHLEALKWNIERQGSEHIETLTSFNILAWSYVAQGRTIEAADLLDKTVVGRTKALGEDHPSTLASRCHRAANLWLQGNLEIAEDEARYVLFASIRSLNEDHPDILVSMNNLACILNDRGKCKEAADLLEQAVPKMQSKLGTKHLSTLTAMSNLAMVYKELNRTSEGILLEKKVLEGKTLIFGENHPATIISKLNLAGLFESEGEVDIAESFISEATKSAQKGISPEKLGITSGKGYRMLRGVYQ